MGSGKSDELQARRYFQGDIGESPLVNKLGITNQNELDKVEAYCVEQALQNGLSNKAKELSANGLKQMHQEFFGAIYEWAGSYRTYTTGRGYPFCRPEFIEKELGKLYQKLNDKLATNTSTQDFIKTSAWFIGELNTIHPFIDGNGRTQRQILSLIAEKSGVKININLLNRDDWYQAAKECHIYATYDGFEKIISSLV
ncbi:MAG: Fic family protein [Moraxella sp.]|nr:Fic family protein [Moraxella sp.]